MRRFYRGSSSDTTKLLFSLILFLCIGCIFYLGILALGDETDEKQRESLDCDPTGHRTLLRNRRPLP